jgi:RND family efflux transporter MFP subunit
MTRRVDAGGTPGMVHRAAAAGARRLALAAAMLLPLVGAAGCSSKAEATSEAQLPPTAIRVRTPTVVDRSATVDASGTVDANTTADLAFQVGGRVARVLVEEGQSVRAGQLLAAIDPIDYELEARRATASAIQAADEYERMKQIHAKGSLAPNDFAKFEAAAQVAAAQDASARERLRKTALTASISGTVARRSIDPGETASAGVPVFTIVAVDPVTIRVGIPEAQIGRIHRGTTATIAVPALAGRRFQARVTMIGVSADPSSRTYPVKLTVPNPGHALLPGMIAEARITGDRWTRTLTVPGEAIVRDADGATLVYVYTPAQRRVYGRRVTVGSPIDREVEITGGLDATDLVVLAGQQRVRDGRLVAATVERAVAGAVQAGSAGTPNREDSPR